MPGGYHGHDQGDHAEIVADGVAVIEQRRIAAAVRVGRLVGLGPVAESPDLRPVGADLLRPDRQVVDESRQLGCVCIGLVLHFLAAGILDVDGEHVQRHHHDARPEQRSAVGEELQEQHHREEQRQDGGEHVFGELRGEADHGQDAVGQLSGRVFLEESGGQGEQSGHQRGLHGIFHLVLHADDQVVAGHLHHDQAGRGAEEQHRDGCDLGGVARRDDFVEQQLARVRGEHGEQHHAQAGQEGADAIVHAQLPQGVPDERADGELPLGQGVGQGEGFLLEALHVPAGVAALPRPGIDESVVGEAGGEQDRRVVIGREGQQLARAAPPPFAFQPDLAEEDLLPVEGLFQLVEVLRDLPLQGEFLPDLAVDHAPEEVGRLVHRLAVAFNTLDQLFEE